MTLFFRNKVRVALLDFFRRTNQLKVFRQYLINQYEFSAVEIDNYQQQKSRKIFEFHYKNNATYRKFLNNKGFYMQKGYSFCDIPFIDKTYFKSNLETHSVKSHIHWAKKSGGSTGVPLAYYLSKETADGTWPAIWRGFDEYDVKPCDKMAMIAGPSLFNNRTVARKVYDWINGFTVISAYDLSDEVLWRAYNRIVKKKIRAIYGYTSSVLIFLQFLQRNNLKLNLKAIFTTSESFIPAVRGLAREYCNCDVIDTYGANDGGVQSFECRHHTGYHLNFEQCLVEIIDGEIVLTDLTNKASPFIRYKVGDYTSSNDIIKERCQCGRSLFRLADISGKVNQMVTDLDGTKIHSGFFTRIFKEDNSIMQFQVIQRVASLRINLIINEEIDKDFYIEKYSPIIARRFKTSFEIVFNEPITKLENQKTPILIIE